MNINTIMWHIVDDICLKYINLVNIGRNFCDRFIDKNNFTIKHITIYLSNDQQYSINISSNSFHYKNIDEFIRHCDIHTIANHISKENDYWLEIVYSYNENRYRIIYNKWDQIKFPPYTLEEIQNVNASNTFKFEIIYADYNEEDITALIKEYAGPKSNFYHDKEFHVTLERIIGSGVLKKYNSKQLIITDNNAEDYSFKDAERIVLNLCKL